MTTPIVPLTWYCVLILLASLAGGMIPVWFRLTHRGMQIAVSFVAAAMFGVGMLHMLPHALIEARAAAAGAKPGADARTVENVEFGVMLWVLAGWLTMFFIERFLCYHHHDLETEPDGSLHEHECTDHGHHHHDVTWAGAALGLTLHSVIGGVALAASVFHRHGTLPLAGLGTFLVIALHKPFDSMTIAMLMTRGKWSLAWRQGINALFSLSIPVGAAIFYALSAAGVSQDEATGSTLLASALAFSAGTFLCISLSDLLPELQFHHHDRVALSAALVAGLVVSVGVAKLEGLVHRHPASPVASAPTETESASADIAFVLR
ncbi:MAG: ZIP family metal transporter [Pirellulales bacterium]|nr:ZIP family metal transporter [Pirellulales bacterium]